MRGGDVDRNQATFEAFDGVEIRLLNGRVVRSSALTVAEAVHYLRLIERVDADDLTAVTEFVAEFPQRVGIQDEKLADLGLEVSGPGAVPLSFGDLTVKDGLSLASLYAQSIQDGPRAPKAQIRVLDEFPATFGLDAAVLAPSDVFDVARGFTEALYLHIYGLARDFCRHLTTSPRVKVMELRAAGSWSSTPASMT